MAGQPCIPLGNLGDAEWWDPDDLFSCPHSSLSWNLQMNNPHFRGWDIRSGCFLLSVCRRWWGWEMKGSLSWTSTGSKDPDWVGRSSVMCSPENIWLLSLFLEKKQISFYKDSCKSVHIVTENVNVNKNIIKSKSDNLTTIYGEINITLKCLMAPSSHLKPE